MFGFSTPRMEERMRQLEQMDAADRKDGTSWDERLKQIKPETGRFLAILAANTPPGEIVEIGTSAGYSTLWLSFAARAKGSKITTYEFLEPKVALARETFQAAGIEEWVELIHGDAARFVDAHQNVAFCFLDGGKEIYEASWDILSDRMVPGGLFVVDNTISHRSELIATIDKAWADSRFDVVEVPVHMGELVCRRRDTPGAPSSGRQP
jgi:predicted O-methyltransferase YrrM